MDMTPDPARGAPDPDSLNGFLEALEVPLEGRDPSPWAAATEALLPPGTLDARARDLQALAAAWAWRQLGRELEATPRDRWPSRVARSGLTRQLGPQATRVLLDEAAGGRPAALALARDEACLARMASLGDEALRDRLLECTEAARVLLETLREDPPTPMGARLAALVPELAALARQHDPMASLEHERADSGRPVRPLLDHLTVRVLGRKLAGLEAGDRGRFQLREGLGEVAFASLVQDLARVREAGLLPVLRAALIHLDFAKGGSPDQREAWRRDLGADLAVHNLAARTILAAARAVGRQDRGLLQGFSGLRDHPAQERLVLALVESHGLAGQELRGETPGAAFAPWVAYLRRDAGTLGASLGVDAPGARQLALTCLHLLNACDTAGVREGLLDDALLAGLAAIRDRLGGEAEAAVATDVAQVTAERLAAAAGPPGPAGAPVRRRALAARLARLRAGRTRAGEPPDEVARLVEAMAEPEAERLAELMGRAQLWYAEAGSSALGAAAQCKLLALGMQAAGGQGRGLFHLSLQPLLEDFLRPDDPATPYRVRLIEALLAPVPLDRILAGEAPALLGGHGGLGTFLGQWGGASSVALDFRASPEAAALLTLLPIYETKSSAAFHATLKSLCDLYGLRKDEFDRVANEALYLEHMNAARSDKARMLDFVVPGRIVEVGPGGGVVLDLLEERFPGSEVIGVDVSAMVVEALERRRAAEGHAWTIVEADAFELPARFGEGTLDTVVFCSLLHEIYSYVEVSDAEGVPRRYQLASVRDLLRAAYRSLRPGGRLVIRDGVQPPEGRRTLRFLAEGAREFFDLFVAQFQGRQIRFEEAGEGAVSLSTADAFEFLYTYNWGPESFPYEVREQYGVLPYEGYREAVLGWLADPDHPPAAVALPPDLASYLQPGYRVGLAGKVELRDEAGRPVELPDSNALWVYEKG